VPGGAETFRRDSGRSNAVAGEPLLDGVRAIFGQHLIGLCRAYVIGVALDSDGSSASNGDDSTESKNRKVKSAFMWLIDTR
jgi:hypothetical protein